MKENKCFIRWMNIFFYLMKKVHSRHFLENLFVLYASFHSYYNTYWSLGILTSLDAKIFILEHQTAQPREAIS